VGKTSIARILAHAINDLPYSEDESHIDIIEIDAASNRGIDEIRDLREKVYVAPAVGKYKVYIIDEVHMLTSQAFNALLKTLEEPPAHVVFILATTESHKLPATIISRTQRYTFRPAQVDDVVKHLSAIAKKEKITIDDAALTLIAEHGDGSFRDSVGLLDQATDGSNAAITIDTIQQLLGVPGEQTITGLLDSLQAGDIAGLTSQLASLQQQGFQAAAIAKQLAKRLRLQLIGQQPLQLDGEQIIAILKELLAVPTSADPGRLLELSLIAALSQPRAALDTLPPEPAAPAAPPTTSPPTPPSSPPKATLPADDPPSSTKPNVPPAASKKPAAASQSVALQPIAGFTEQVWPEVLAEIKKRYNTLYSILRMAQPSFSQDSLTLSFGFAFHQKRINEAKNKKIITDIIEQLTGQGVAISCILEEKPAAKIPKSGPADAGEPADSPTDGSPTSAADPLKSISNIFGGGELL